MPLGGQVLQSAETRVFLQEGGAAPGNRALYKGFVQAGSLSQGFGDVTPVRIPSRTAYGQYDTIGKIRGQQDLPTFSANAYQRRLQSGFFTLGVRGCPATIHIHAGACEDPSAFNEGWQMGWIVGNADLTQWGTAGDLGAMDGDQNEVVTENVDTTADYIYQIVKETFGQKASAEITDPVVAVLVPSQQSCASCGVDNDGTKVVIAIMSGTTGSPGLPTEYVYTKDGGSTFGTGQITSMSISEVALGAAIVGSYVVVISGGSDDNIHYALLSDVLAGRSNIWSAVETGIVASGSPAAIAAYDAANAWIAGQSGYIYKLVSPSGGVTVQSAGDVTVQNLNDIMAFDEQNVLAVGASNAVLYTINGGLAWIAVTGPAVGAALNACWMASPTTWFVGTATGRLFYTKDSGASWTEITQAALGTGSILDIAFATQEVGYVSHRTSATAARILRTIDGGDTWYALPEAGGGTMVAADQFTALGVPRFLHGQLGANTVWAGGIADNGTDGILVLGAGPEAA